MSSFEAVVDAVRDEGMSLRQQLASQAPEQESPAVRDRKESEEEGREVKKVDLLTTIAENVTGQQKKLDEIDDRGDGSLWGAFKKALLFGTIALAIPAIQGFLEAKGWKGLKDGFQKLYCFLIEGESIIDKTSRFVKEEILPLLTIEGLKRLASNLNKYIFTPLRRLYGSVAGFLKDLYDGCFDKQIEKIATNLNKYIFTPLGRFYGKLVTFFRNLFEGKYDKQIEKIATNLNKYIFTPLGILYRSVVSSFRDLAAGCYDEEIKKIKFAFNKFILSPLKSFGGWVSRVKMEDLEKAGREINGALIIIGGVLAATKAVFDAITMPIRGLLLLYDTITDLFSDEENKQKLTRLGIAERRLQQMKDSPSANPEMVAKQQKEVDRLQALTAGQAGQNFDDVPEAMAPETSNKQFFMLLRSETNKRNEELKKAKTELEGEIGRRAAAVTIFQGRLAKGMLVGKAFKDATEAITKSREIIKGKELELRPVLKELEQMERRRDYVNRLTRGEAMIPLEKMDEVIDKINTAALSKTGGAGAPVQINNVSPTTVDASTSSVTSAPSTPISPSPNYVAIL